MAVWTGLKTTSAATDECSNTHPAHGRAASLDRMRGQSLGARHAGRMIWSKKNLRLRLKDRSKENEQQLHVASGVIPTRHRFWLGVTVAVLVVVVDTDHVNSDLVDCASTAAATVVSLNTFALQHVYVTSSNHNCTERLMSVPLRNYSLTRSLTPENNYTPNHKNVTFYFWL